MAAQRPLTAPTLCQPPLDLSANPHDQAIQLMATWISAIADQVKNPVAGISAAASLIEKQMTAFRAADPWNPDIVEEAVRLMLERLSRFDNYLSELSGFTRPMDISPTSIHLKNEWPSIYAFLIRRVAMDFDLRERIESDLHINADLERLKLALAAITSNSAEACGSDQRADILLTTRKFQEKDRMKAGHLVELSDNGPGFSKDALVQGVNPFFTTKDAGTGLGLAMVDKCMRAHGGWLRIANLEDGGVVTGARISLFFPDQ